MTPEQKLETIRDLIQDEMAEPITSIVAMYHRRTELRDAIMEVLVDE
jgi:hypothetical protein